MNPRTVKVVRTLIETFFQYKDIDQSLSGGSKRNGEEDDKTYDDVGLADFIVQQSENGLINSRAAALLLCSEHTLS